MKLRDYWRWIRNGFPLEPRPTPIRTRCQPPKSRSALLEQLETRELLTASIQISDGGTQLSNWAYESFGQVTVGDTALKTFTVANSGDEQLEVNQPSTPSGFSVQGAFPLYVNPGSSADFTLSMNTSSPNQYSGQLWIDNSDPNNEPFLINLDGTVVAPPPALTVYDGTTTITNEQSGYGMNPDDFGNTPQGTPIDKVFTITNSSASVLSVSHLSLPSGFSLVGTFPTTVPANGSTTFSVQLDATAISTPSGELSFSDTDPGGGSYQFGINGTVVAAANPVMELYDGATAIANSGSDSFGSVSQGGSDSRTFTVDDSGQNDLTISAISLPTGYSLQTALPLNVPAGGSATFKVALDTSAVGTLSGTMSVANDDPNNNPYTVSLSGTVTPPAPVMQLLQGTTSIANGGPAAMPAAIQGTSDTATLTVENTGTAPLTVSAVTLPTGYSLQTALPLSIAAGGNAALVVALDTSALGKFTGTMSLSDTDASNNPYNVSLSGTVYAPPVANDDSYSTSHRKTLTVAAASGVAANDTNPSQAPLTVQLVAGPQDGTLALNADGSFVYAPSGSYVGADSFSYDVVAQGVVSNTATAHIQVTNAAPVAADDTYSVNYSTAFSSGAPGVLANDTDADGDPLTAQLVAGPSDGTLTLNADGSFTYTPNSGFLGADSFTYQVADGLATSNLATVRLNVSDPGSQAKSDSYSVIHGHTLTVSAPGVLANDEPPGGPPLTASLASGPSHGTLVFNADGSFSYTPAASYLGADQFTYTETDGVSTGVAVATINVTNTAPIAGNISFHVPHGQTLTAAAPGVLANAEDADGDPLSLQLITGVQDGTLTLNPDGSFTYVPNTGFSETIVSPTR